MRERIFYSAGQTEALEYGVAYLRHRGCRFATKPDSSVTHLILDTPHKAWESIPALLEKLPRNITVVGGNLQHPLLQDYQTVDLLQDPMYLAENANITAHGAVKLALAHLPVTLHRCPVLVIGWGRIGKCLAQLLRQMGAHVTVSTRKEADRAMLIALGFEAVDLSAEVPVDTRVVFNTVPVPVLTAQQCPTKCLKLELASSPGIEGADVVNARGLPSRCAPESSGELIARSILRLTR